MAAYGKHASGRMRIVTDRKITRKEAWVNYFKTMINKSHQNDSWMELNGEESLVPLRI